MSEKPEPEAVVETTVLTPTTLVKVTCSCGHPFVTRSSEAFHEARKNHLAKVHAPAPEEVPPPSAFEPIDEESPS